MFIIHHFSNSNLPTMQTGYNKMHTQKVKKEADLYSAFIEVPYTQA